MIDSISKIKILNYSNKKNILCRFIINTVFRFSRAFWVLTIQINSFFIFNNNFTLKTALVTIITGRNYIKFLPIKNSIIIHDISQI